jgi:hypothetical protein
MAGNLLLPGDIVSMAAGVRRPAGQGRGRDAALLYLYLLRRGACFPPRGPGRPWAGAPTG